MTGNLDLVAACLTKFEKELKALGFSKPVGLGHTLPGWIHAELKLGFEVVASSLFGGAIRRDQ